MKNLLYLFICLSGFVLVAHNPEPTITYDAKMEKRCWTPKCSELCPTPSELADCPTPSKLDSENNMTPRGKFCSVNDATHSLNNARTLIVSTFVKRSSELIK